MKWFSKIKSESIDSSMTSDKDSFSETEDLAAVEQSTVAESKVLPETIAQDVKRKTSVFQPITYSSIKPIVEELINYKVVLVDLSKLSDADRLRTIDFISGVMYGLDGEYKKIDYKIYKFIVRK